MNYTNLKREVPTTKDVKTAVDKYLYTKLHDVTSEKTTILKYIVNFYVDLKCEIFFSIKF